MKLKFQGISEEFEVEVAVEVEVEVEVEGYLG